MKKKLQVLKFLTWYKSLQEENIKIRLLNCKTRLEKLVGEKNSTISFRKNCYHRLEKNILKGEEFKYILFLINKSIEFEEKLNQEIELQEKQLKELINALEKAYKEKKLMENFYTKTWQLWNIENIRKFYKEMDDLILLRTGRKYA